MLFEHIIFLLLLCDAFNYLCDSSDTVESLPLSFCHEIPQTASVSQKMTGLASTPAADLVGVKMLMNRWLVLVNTFLSSA
jgi:hypothetical protein